MNPSGSDVAFAFVFTSIQRNSFCNIAFAWCQHNSVNSRYFRTRLHSSVFTCSVGGGLLQGGVCSRGVSAQGVCLLHGGVCSWGVSAPEGCLLQRGVCSRGGVCSRWVCSGGVCSEGVCSGGCLFWGSLLWGVCIPACTEADTALLTE